MKPVPSAATVLYTPAAPVLAEPSEADDPRLTIAMEEYLSKLEAGERPDRETFLARHPGLADKLPQLLDNLDFVHQVAPQLRSSPGQEFTSAQPASLGDFRIVREVGRGGMGVVYEAEQISLARRVALKVLPFAAVMDPRRLARFRNEAQAAATLTHQHIVPVYAVGSAQGVHYYAMQFIDGCTLADMIEQLRQAAGKTSSNSPASHSQAAKQLAQGLTIGRASSMASKSPQVLPPISPQQSAPAGETVRAAQAAISTENSHANAHYVRTVTELSVQIAEALDYAHRQGVVHRDIKPGNLLLDMQGNPWITDFGLARIETEANLTMTGDLVGTLRYMSPEQALAQCVVVDHRTDIYSFGVTLYELLTLEPLFAASNRQELLRDIAFREPTSLRKLQRSIPADLETIVMKAMAKNPAERYSTAQEMADDLRRLLADQPIRARRPSLTQRVRRWSRRHRAIVTTASVVAACSLVLGAGLLWRERSLTLAALEQARHEREVARGNLQQAQQAVEQFYTRISESKLLEVPDMAPLRQELLKDALKYYQAFVEQRRDDLLMQAELAAAQLRISRIYATTGSAKWLDAQQESIDIVERLLARGENPSQWVGLNGGTWNYRGGLPLGRLDESILVQERFVETWQKLVKAAPGVAGFEHDLAGGYFTLAAFQAASGRSNEAIPNYDKARLIWRELLRKHPTKLEYSVWFIRSGAFLSTELAKSGRTAEVKNLVLEIIADLHKLPGADVLKHPAPYEDLTASYQGLIDSLSAQGKYDEAENAIREALANSRKQFGDKNWIVAVTLHMLAEAIVHQRGYDIEAEEACHSALAINCELFGHESVQVADVLMTFGSLERARRDQMAAQKFYQKALAIRRKTLGYEHPQVASTLQNLALSLTDQGKEEEAEEAIREREAIKRKLLGDGSSP